MFLCGYLFFISLRLLLQFCVQLLLNCSILINCLEVFDNISHIVGFCVEIVSHSLRPKKKDRLNAFFIKGKNINNF